MAIVLMVVIDGWSGFYEGYIGKLPLIPFFVIVGMSTKNSNDVIEKTNCIQATTKSFKKNNNFL